MPLSELGGDFYDELKSVSSGYASFDYEEAEYRSGDVASAHLSATADCGCVSTAWTRFVQVIQEASTSSTDCAFDTAMSAMAQDIEMT